MTFGVADLLRILLKRLMSPERSNDHIVDAFNAVGRAVTRLSAPRPTAGLAMTLEKSLEELLQSEDRCADEPTSWSAVLPDGLRCHIDRTDATTRRRAIASHADVRSRQWQVATIEMLDRLAHDWPNIANAFDIDPTASLESVSPALGDRHNHGRFVCRLGFAGGRFVIYKPRPVRTEQTFGRFLDVLRESGCEPAFGTFGTLSRKGYGWTEYIRPSPCKSRVEATRFYTRQGGFVALFWLLGGYDTLVENVVVHQDHPVWIDTECICRPEVRQTGPLTAAMPAWIAQSPLTTGMVLYGKQAGASERQSTGLSVSCSRVRANVFTDEDVLKDLYLDAVLRGFRDVYTWLLANRDVLASDHGPLSWWRDVPVRVIVRATMSYAAMVRLWMITPPDSRDEVRHDLREVLCSVEGDTDGRCPPWPSEMVDADLAAIERGDIPYWTTTTTSRDLCEAAGARVTSVVSMTGMEFLAQRLDAMSAYDLTRQLWLLESFLGRRASVAR